MAVLTQVQAMKHSFHINRTTHQLIGPIGAPFGFNARGHYLLQVYDFELSVRYNATMKMLLKEYKKQTKKGKKSKIDASVIEKVQQQQQDIIDSVEAGFFLRKYENLASFHQYMNILRANATLCSFQHFIPPKQRLLNDGLDDTVDDGTPYDDDGASGDDFVPSKAWTDDWDPSRGDPGKPMKYSTAKDGIFFSMQSKSNTWKPNAPSIEYRFQKYVGNVCLVLAPTSLSILTLFSIISAEAKKDSIFYCIKSVLPATISCPRSSWTFTLTIPTPTFRPASSICRCCTSGLPSAISSVSPFGTAISAPFNAASGDIFPNQMPRHHRCSIRFIKS
jgi:hypothetical protein